MSVMIPRFFFVTDIPRISACALLLQAFEVTPPPLRCAAVKLFVRPLTAYYHLPKI